MSRQQWGHGFHSGIEAMEKKAGFPVGFYFLGDFAPGDAHQGKVISVSKDNYLVRCFSWIDGHLGENVYELSREQMKDWQWFETSDSLRDAADAYAATVFNVLGTPS